MDEATHFKFGVLTELVTEWLQKASLYKVEEPSLEVAPTTLLLIYSFQFRSAFMPTVPSIASFSAVCMCIRKCFPPVNFPSVTLNFDL